MGFSFKSLAVQSTPASVLSLLNLRATGTFEEVPESPLTGALLPSGWYLITDNSFSPVINATSLARLSEIADVVTLTVEEHVMCSEASAWSSGRQVWLAMHEAEQGITHLRTTGDLPEFFIEISARLHAEQAAAGRENAGVDHIFDIPVNLFAHLTGYRHDRAMPELGERAFEALASELTKGGPSLLKKLFKPWR